MIKCKITVLKRMFNQDLVREYCASEADLCPVFTEGQEFIYEAYGDGNKPEGFCEQAWNDIYKYVLALSVNGNFTGWMKKDGINIVCCTDGLRPVVFKLERIETK
jgi:uncharacterized repeat protein (TIGR04076 family)